jgi:hypothetical protein
MGRLGSTCLGDGGLGAITISSSYSSGAWSSSNLLVPKVAKKVGEELSNRGKRKSRSCRLGWIKYSILKNRRSGTLSEYPMMRRWQNRCRLRCPIRLRHRLLHKWLKSKIKSKKSLGQLRERLNL